MTPTTSEFDIASIEAADTAVLDVLDQKEEPMIGVGGQPVPIEMYGPGSLQYAKAQARIDSASQTRAFAAIRGKTVKDGPEETRRLTAEKLAACTKSVNNLPVPAIDLYSNPRLGYITAQANKFLEDWSNFLSESAKT